MSPLPPRPFWNPLLAGVALGLVLILTFVWTGHGLGATGATTRLSAWLGAELAPQATQANAYLGPMLEGGNPLDSWITWELLGVAAGAWVSALIGRRFRISFDHSPAVKAPRRVLAAFGGGLLSGFGARVSLGCTSGLGLSGAATLGVAAFVFLVAFFAMGLLTSRLVKGV